MSTLKPLSIIDLEHIFSGCASLWSEFAGKRIFITGGTGFFGLWLLESLVYAERRLGAGMHMFVLSRDPEAFLLKAPHLAACPALHFCRGDIRTFEFPEGPFDYLIHAATDATTKRDGMHSLEMFDSLVTGTRRVLDFCHQAGVRRILFTSSGAVYGPQPSELARVGEDYAGAPDPLCSSSAYGEGKRAAEHLCAIHAIAHGYECVVARCFAFVGPHLPLDGSYAVGNFLRDALAGRPIRIAGDGTPERSYLHAADLAIWLWTLLLRGQSSRAYNVGSDVSISIADLAHLVAQRSGENSLVEIAGTPVVGRPSSRYIPSISRAGTELGLSVRIDLAAALDRTLAWHHLFK